MESEGSLLFHSPPLVPILSQMHTVHIFPLYFLRSILMLSSYLRLRLQYGLSLSGFPTKISYAFLIFLCVLRAPPISSFGSSLYLVLNISERSSIQLCLFITPYRYVGQMSAAVKEPCESLGVALTLHILDQKRCEWYNEGHEVVVIILKLCWDYIQLQVLAAFACLTSVSIRI
jgi:hypothetical protein